MWDPFKRNYRSICGYGNLMIEISSELHMTEGGTKAILLSGRKPNWRLSKGMDNSIRAPVVWLRSVFVFTLWCEKLTASSRLEVAYYSFHTFKQADVYSYFNLMKLPAAPCMCCYDLLYLKHALMRCFTQKSCRQHSGLSVIWVNWLSNAPQKAK